MRGPKRGFDMDWECEMGAREMLEWCVAASSGSEMGAGRRRVPEARRS